MREVKIGEWVITRDKHDQEVDGFIGQLSLDDGSDIPYYVDCAEGEGVWCRELTLIEGEGWRQRELARIRVDYHVALPKQVSDWLKAKEVVLSRDHFVHQSRKDIGSIAYTQNDSKGERDIQTPMKFGRYLNKYYSAKLTGGDIKEVVEIFNSFVLKVEFATTREDIKRVYEDGPYSCMGKKTSYFRTEPIHPCEPYAAGDLAIAHIGDSARCLCWPEKKIYGVVYGNNSLKHALDNMGYKDAGKSDHGFHGAKLLRLEIDGEIVIPYIDGHQYMVEIYDNHLIIDVDAIHNSQSSHHTSGFLTICQKCEICTDAIPKQDIIKIECDGKEVCPSCRCSLYKEALVNKKEKVLLPKEKCFNALGKWYSNDVNFEELGLVRVDSSTVTTKLAIERTKLSKESNFKTSLSCIAYLGPYKAGKKATIIPANTTLRTYGERVGDWVKVMYGDVPVWVSSRRGRIVERNDNPLGFNLSLLWGGVDLTAMSVGA